MKRNKLLKQCLLVFLTISCCLLTLIGCSRLTFGQETTYTVQYTYEKLDGRKDIITMTYNGRSGETVEAPELPVLGYEIDTESAAYVGSGKVEVDGSLLLQVPYKLKVSDIIVETSDKYTVSTTVGNENKTSAKFGEVVTVEISLTEGYTLETVSVQKVDGTAIVVSNNKFIMPESAVTVSAVLCENEFTPYKTQYWIKSLNGVDYLLEKEQTSFGASGTKVSAMPLANNGLVEVTNHSDRKAEGDIIADGSLILKLYYDRRSFDLTKYSTDISFELDKNSALYGETVTVLNIGNIQEGYQAKVGYYKTGDDTASMIWAEEKEDAFVFEMPAYACTVKVVAIAKNDVRYKVQNWVENVTGDGYTLYSTEEYFSTSGISVNAEVQDLQGFVFDENNKDNQLSGVVKADGSLKLKVFYAREKYTVQFKDYQGETVATSEEKYGTKVSALPEMDYYIHSIDKYFYWATEDGKLFDAAMPISGNLTLTQRFYDQVIYTKEDFYKAFNAVDKNDGYGYVSTTIATGSYILMSDIDFGGDYIEFGGLSGLLEGNGYALKNINISHGWFSTAMNSNTRFISLFRDVSGIIRNVSFEGLKFNQGQHGYEKSGRGIIGYAGLLIGNFSGKLENVYVNGSMRGIVYGQMSWDLSRYFQSPSDDAEGSPVAGAVIFNSQGGTLKNVVVNVISENSYGYASDLSLIAGKGLFSAENVYVIADAEENASNRTVTRGMSAQDMGVQFGTTADLQVAMNATLGAEKAWNIENLVAGKTPTVFNCVARSKFRMYMVNHYLAVDDKSTKTDLSGYTLYMQEKGSAISGEMTSATALNLFGFEPENITQVLVADDDSSEVNIFYKRDMLVETFEQYPVPATGMYEQEPWSWADGSISYKGTKIADFGPVAADIPHIVTKDSVSASWMGAVASPSESPYEGNNSMRFGWNSVGMNITIYLTEAQKEAYAEGGTLTFAIKWTGAGSVGYTFSISGNKDWTSSDMNAFHKYNYSTDGCDIWQNHYATTWSVITIGEKSRTKIIENGYFTLNGWTTNEAKDSGGCIWIDNVVVTPKN